jgi:hypothetical protein
MDDLEFRVAHGGCGAKSLLSTVFGFKKTNRSLIKVGFADFQPSACLLLFLPGWECAAIFIDGALRENRKCETDSHRQLDESHHT